MLGAVKGWGREGLGLCVVSELVQQMAGKCIFSFGRTDPRLHPAAEKRFVSK
jgi:hypothetical protein